ncbi:MAG: hypothetical protein BMS9Abin30_0362 [Gammaproteobacteria bacterium]|nr:MAG: hypothetical protein BMS9Abin30_0362 [Gammaproteobacteria bacterium]
MSFFNELKRRNVIRVGIAYAVATWLLMQIVDLVLENIHAPDWVMQVFMLALAVGFPIAIIIAWAFEMTPDGIKLEKNVDRSQSITRDTGKQLNRGIIVILLVLVVFLLTDRFRENDSGVPANNLPGSQSTQQEIEQTDDAEATQSIAVLPFRDMSAAQDQAYFGEGIAEELLNALVKLKGLHVASRTSTFSLVDEDLDIPTIAERLGVTTVLEGSIRTSGQKVRVTAQLIDVKADVHLWSETYNGSLDDIFKIQDEITAKIIEAMKVQLGGEAIASASTELTDNAEAYQLYLKGRHFWRQRTATSLNRAIGLFKQAIDLDPGFHRAWSNLAAAYKVLPTYDSHVSFDEYVQLSIKAANQALEIDAESSEALTVIADSYAYQCNGIAAAEGYQKAINANPQDPTAHHWYAMLLMERGRTAQAIEQIRLARSIDPLISAVISVESSLSMIQGNYLQAGVLSRQAAELGIYQGSGYPEGMAEALQGNFGRARALMEAGLIDVDDLQLTGIKLFLDAMEDPGKTGDFESFISSIKDIPPGDYYLFGEMLAVLGSPRFVNYSLESGCADINEMIWAKPFRVQRGTPEFFAYMEKIGAVDYWRKYGWPDDCASLDQTLAECD